MRDPGPRDLDPVITDYYDRAPEEARLQQGPFQLEEARTRELIQRFAPPPRVPSWTLVGRPGPMPSGSPRPGIRCTWSIRWRRPSRGRPRLRERASAGSFNPTGHRDHHAVQASRVPLER